MSSRQRVAKKLLHLWNSHIYRAGAYLAKPGPCSSIMMMVPLVGVALIDVGEALRELAEVKDALDMEVKQNFIDPLQNLHEKDLKEIQVGYLEGSWQEVRRLTRCLFSSCSIT